MVINILKIGLLITAAQFLMSSGCNKGGTTPCISGTPRYSFTATSEFSPQKEVYNVGDTIFFNSTIPKVLIDQVSNQQVDYSNSLGVGGSFGLAYLDSINRQSLPARDSFNIIFSKGTLIENPIISSRNGGFNVEYFEQSNYILTILLICKKKGVYGFGFSSVGSKGLPNKNCTNASFDMTVTNSDKHFNLFQNTIGIPMDALGAKTSYCFRVQ